MWLRTSLGDLRLVFFLYTSLKISPKLGYILYVCALARLISASSKEKILRLDSLRSNLSCRNPQLDGAKFNSAVNLKRAAR